MKTALKLFRQIGLGMLFFTLALLMAFTVAGILQASGSILEMACASALCGFFLHAAVQTFFGEGS